MRADYGERYRELYQHHWWWRARERYILDTLRAQRPPQGWGTILDIGCGDALFFDKLSEFGEVEGIEPDPKIVNPAGCYRNRIHVRPFDDSFQPAKRFSLVLMLDVLEHLSQPAEALRHALALLEPDGNILVTVPSFMLLWTNHDSLNDHIVRYTKKTFRQLAHKAGMSVEVESYFFQWLFPAKLASRAVEGIFKLQPQPPTIPPRLINAFLYWLSRFEQKVWDRLSVPFGSSLLVMGRKSKPVPSDQPAAFDNSMPAADNSL